MNRSRRQAYDTRTGGIRTSQGAAGVGASASSAAAVYEALLPQLARLRVALNADRPGSRPLADVRRDHAEFDRSLADAVSQAFAADARGAPTPHGMSSWVAEGLARSKERELALFTAADVGGVLRAATVPGPRWATENDLERRPGGGHPTPATREEAAP
jgi:hypothetical protein